MDVILQVRELFGERLAGLSECGTERFKVG